MAKIDLPDVFSAAFVEREPGGKLPLVNMEDMTGRVTAGELILYADNPAEMSNAVTGSLIIEVYHDRWHIAEAW